MMENITLNDGVQIPQVGFGVFMIPNDGSTYKAVKEALEAGYRHIDTAAAYFNEEEVGKAVNASGISRSEIFITSKLWLQDHGYDNAKNGIERSIRKLGTHIDLYLLHQPYGDVTGAWKALEEYKSFGMIRSIGVSNMTPNLYKKYVSEFESKPSVNQVECNPFCQQIALRELMKTDDVKLEAYFPLGHGNKELLENEFIRELADKYGRDTAQIILRFEVQDGLIVLPKSSNSGRIKSNIEIFDFELTPEEMEAMRGLDRGETSHDPEAPGVEEKLRSTFVIED